MRTYENGLLEGKIEALTATVRQIGALVRVVDAKVDGLATEMGELRGERRARKALTTTLVVLGGGSVGVLGKVLLELLQ